VRRVGYQRFGKNLPIIALKYQTTRRHLPQDGAFRSHRCKSFKYRNIEFSSLCAVCLGKGGGGLALVPGQSMLDLWSTKWHWDRYSLPVLQFSPVNFIPPMLCTHSSLTGVVQTLQLTASLVTSHEELSALQLCSWPPSAVFCAGPINSGTKSPEPDSTSSVLSHPVRCHNAATSCRRRLLDEVPKDYSRFTEHDVSKYWCTAEASDLRIERFDSRTVHRYPDWSCLVVVCSPYRNIPR
jgi:hypothetical protein